MSHSWILRYIEQQVTQCISGLAVITIVGREGFPSGRNRDSLGSWIDLRSMSRWCQVGAHDRTIFRAVSL